MIECPLCGDEFEPVKTQYICVPCANEQDEEYYAWFPEER